jgi:hypothetical protein
MANAAMTTPTSTRRRGPGVLAIAILLSAAAAGAQTPPPPGMSLKNCQNTVAVEGLKYEQGLIKAGRTCLQKMATALMQNGVSPTAGATSAASACVSQFRKLNDSRGLGLSLPEKLAARVTLKCDPTQAGVTHTLDDVTGQGVGLVGEQIEAANLDAWCQQFGGDGSIDSLAEWTACVQRSHECAAEAALATEYPRALEWLDLIVAAMGSVVPPPTDPAKVADALVAATALNSAIEGAGNDDVPNLQCGTTCGDGARNGYEACDGADLGGATCTGLGFAAGTLACTATCQLDLGVCTPFSSEQFPATGQTTCWNSSGTVVSCAGTGHDGDTLGGTALSYTDNGDGTITDNNTKLVWEKLADDGSIHDRDIQYSWDNAVAVHVGGLNTASFAGYTDWRVPNVKELLSIVDYENVGPAVSTAFNTGCTPGCTVLSCSCTAAFNYWSSTTYVITPGNAWFVNFHSGLPNAGGKPFSNHVRAVRGGS